MSFQTWATVYIILMIPSVCFVEMGWRKAHRLRTGQDEERDRHFPAFRRLEDFNKISLTQVRLFAVFFLPIILSLACLIFVSMIFICWLSCLGWDENTNMTGFRRYFLRISAYTLGMIFFLLTLGCIPKVRVIEYDYSKYLGPNYKSQQKLPLKVSTLCIAPHQSIFD